jgi:hypothetical protein
MSYLEVKKELQGLIDIIDYYGNCDLSDADKMHLARNVAYTVSVLRHKYKITSAYFTAAEIAAEKLYGERFKKE